MPPPLSLLLALFAALAHDFHISRLTVNLDAAQARTEMTLHTFVDDLELAVATHHDLARASQRDPRLPTHETLDLLAPTEHPLADSLVEAYVRYKIRVRAGEAPVAIRYLGAEAADDPYAMYVYLAAPLPTGGTGLTVHSRFFTELFGDQQNVVAWQRDGEAADYALLTAREDETTLAP